MTMSNESESKTKIKSAYEKAMERLDNVNESPENATAEGAEENPTVEAGSEEAEAEVQVINLDYKDKYLRALADLENFRKRTNRDKETWSTEAIRRFASDFIDIFDNLNMAIKTTHSNDIANDPTFVEGVQSIRDQFKNQLAQHKVTQIEAKPGDPYDADHHEVLMVKESAEHTGQSLGLILRPGYKIGTRVLRPTQVQLIKGSPKAE